MRKKVETEIDTDLVEEPIRRFHLADAREAVPLALRPCSATADDLLVQTNVEGSSQF